MRRLLIAAAAAGSLALLGVGTIRVLTLLAGGAGSTAAWANATCAGCHRS